MTDATRIAELATLIRVLKREVAELEPRIVSVKAQLAASEAELLNLQPARQPKADVAEAAADANQTETAQPDPADVPHAEPLAPEDGVQASTLTPPAGENLDPSQSTETSTEADPAGTVAQPAQEADKAPAAHDEAKA